MGSPPWLAPQHRSHVDQMPTGQTQGAGAYGRCLALAHCQQQDEPQHCSGSPEDTPRSSGASGIFSLRNLAADSLLPTLLERAAPEDVDRRNEALRRQQRAPALLTLYPAPDEVGAHQLTAPRPRSQPAFPGCSLYTHLQLMTLFGPLFVRPEVLIFTVAQPMSVACLLYTSI